MFFFSFSQMSYRAANEHDFYIHMCMYFIWQFLLFLRFLKLVGCWLVAKVQYKEEQFYDAHCTLSLSTIQEWAVGTR